MSQLNSILSLFEITDPNIFITGISQSTDQNGLHIHRIHATLINTPICCPHCNSESLIKNGKHLSHIRLGTLNGGRYELELSRQRYLCHNCQKTCGAKTTIVQMNHTFSNNINHQVIQLARKSITAKTIAEILAISCSSVQRIINNEVHQSYRIKILPEHLCFDEFRSCQKLMSFNCCDSVTHERVVLLKDRLSKSIIDYFESHFSLVERGNVLSVVVDMNAAYASFIHRLFPNAKVIIDRFHIVQLAGKALDKERVNLVQTVPDTHSRIHRILKSQWKLFHLQATEIDATRVRYLFGVNEYMTQQNAIDLGLDQSPQFKVVYQIYQDLLQAIRTGDSKRMTTLLNHYRVTHTEMDTVMATLRKNKIAVINSCLFQYSNGPLEGINRKIKVLKRNCYGFRNRENFFTRIALIYK
ncbi:MAG: ISL3 family transposase [Lactobacillaceae bacterium]|jgi:transposase|nr:ISL3 family transposase [Lactobacillaceae bacterium]